MSAHATELSLRRMFAGEAIAPDLKAHADGCDECRSKLRSIEDEQRRFEAAIPFERFAAGVERAARNPRDVSRPQRKWVRYAMAIAATVLVVATVPLVMPREHSTRTKGGPSVEMIVKGAGPQRVALPNVPEALAAGERVRVSYSVESGRHIVVASVDERGEVNTIPEKGSSMRVHGDDFFPNDSIEFTGHGSEHVVIVLTREPLAVDEVRRAVRVRYDEARGNLDQLGTLDLPGDQYHWTFLKP